MKRKSGLPRLMVVNSTGAYSLKVSSSYSEALNTIYVNILRVYPETLGELAKNEKRVLPGESELLQVEDRKEE